MNKVYNVIWSSALNALVVVAEGTKSRSKSTVRGLRVLVAFLLLAPASGMSATLPQGGMISIGEGTIVNSGTGQMTIKQSTDKLGINWQSFNVGADGKVIFDQPNKNSVALNRVIGSDASTILGRIEANGQVFLINPNGVIFGKDSKVNVGGLVASTLDISDEDFKNGNYHFSAGASNGEIINNGTLQAAEGGYVAVLGKSVKNNGLIKAQLGTTALAAGDAVTLDFSGDGLINVQVDKSAVNALAENKGLIKADGGNVLMTARASNALLNTVVNNEGVIEAQTIGARGGKIFLDGGTDSGTVLVAGTLDASAPVSGDGGFIETSGAHVKIANGTKVTTLSKEGTTGDWLVDPTDFNIVSGNAAQTSSQIGATTLQDNLALTNVTLQTAASGTENGDINVNADVTWSANTTLTLDAHGDINFNENVNVLGATGGLDLKYGSNGTVAGKMVKIAKNKKVNLTGAGTTYSENGKSYIVIRTAADLALFNGPNGNLNYVLGSDIDASVTSTWNAGLGYAPGGRADTFVGALQGLNHKISDLYINRPTADYVGLFGYSNGAKYSNLSITGNVTGKSYTGLLAGQATDGSIYNVDVSGTVVGKSGSVGGLAGSISREDISYVNSNVVVTGAGSAVGGLIGELNTSALSQAFSKGSVNNTAIWTGGLIGILRASTLDSIYSTSSVEGTDRTGGLVGAELSANTISNAYSTGTVIGQNYVGGFAGSSADGILSNVFTTSDVTGNDQVGGFVGYLYNSKVNFAYSTGAVVGATNTGGFGGLTSGADSEISYTYTTSDVAATSWAHSSGNGVRLENYYINTSLGMQSPGMSQGITKAQLQSAATFTNWDISNVGGDGKRWRVYEGQSGPLLRSFMTSVILGGGATADYKGSVLADGDVTANFTFDSTLSNSIFQSNGDFAYELTSGGSAIRNAGTYALDAFYSTQFGYDIAVPVPVNLVVNKAHLTIGANASSKNYDGNTSAVVSLTDDRIGSDDLVISAGSKNFSDKNAGTGKTVTVGGITVTGADAMNYTWDASVVTSADIAKANLTISANGGNKTYNGSTDANVSLTDNRFGLDDLVVGSVSSSFADKNAGTGKTITVNGITVTGADAGNYTWNTSVLTTADITKAALNIAASGVNKTYDGSATADANLSDNRIGADDLVIGSAGKAFADKNAGNGKVITVSGITVTGADSGNYSWNTSAVTTADIAKAALSITADAASKVYDGTTNAGITLNFDNVLGDDLSVSALSQAFDNKNAGTNKAVTVGLSLSGADADNYVWNTSTVAYADITKASLSISAVASDKTYDGTSSAGVTLSDDRIAGDDLILSAGASTFTDKNAGSGKLVIASGLNVTGADANNYTWNTSASDVADIAKADLAITAAGINKTYDTTASANATLSDSRVLGDDLTVSMSGASFSDKNAGNGKTVTVNGITVTGADADNYTWSNTASTTADIAKANLTISAIANDKVYDATTNAETTISDNRLGSDDLVITKTGSSFDDKNAGLNKTVTVEFTVGGADAGNYDWNTTATDTASVSKAQLNITAGAASKDYDATTDATVFFADDRIAGDSLTVGKTQAYFDNKNAGMNKTVTVDGITLTGADAGNYEWNTSTTTVADVGRVVLSITANGIDKTYDGTKNASVNLVDSRLGSDDLIITADDVSFTDKNADTGKQISVSGINVSGADASNYIWDTTAVATADINKAVLNVSAVASDKTYDGTTAASTTLSDNRIAGDNLVISGSSSFSDKNAGAGKTVLVDGIDVSGADAQNYTWNDSTLATATIEKAQLDITLGAASKDYDGTTHADAFLSDNRIAGDSITLGHASANFADKNAGTGKTVTVDGISVTGADADNYVWNASGTTTADIGRAVLIINATGVNKTYDGTTDASSVFSDNRIGADDLIVTADSISFVDKNADTGKQISISGINISGADANNYIWDATAVTTANITKANLDVSAIASGKTYDGNTSVSTTLSDNRISGDSLVITSSNAFADKNAGANKTVNIDSINVTGADAQNYTWNTSATTTADISKAQLDITIGAAGKDYDGTTNADVFLSDNRVSGDSLAFTHDQAFFDNKNAGTGKLVTVEDIGLIGADAGNYTWNTTATTTADIGRAVLSINATGVNKTYDGTTDASSTFTDNRLGSDDLSISADSISFIDKNAEFGKQISISGINVTGADAGNYIWDTTGIATADISKATLNVTATAGGKTYDGTTGVSTTLADNRLGSDDLVITSNSAFADKNAGLGKTVNIDSINVTGADAGNYVWNTDTTTNADISKAQLVVTVDAASKDYDSTVHADAFLSDNRIAGDSLVLNYGSASFSDKNAGSGKTVTADGITVTGLDAGNYEWNTSGVTTADIGRAVLTIDATGVNKTYDANTSATVNFTDNRLGSDSLIISADESTFIDKNAEAGKQISISGITVTGADAGNYIWDTTGVATADIAKANLSVTATAGDKTYDGTTGVSTTLSDNRFGSDDLVISSNAAFTDKNAGVGKTVNVNDIIVTGADAQNYTWNATTSTTANIGKATLQIDASATDKIYDGSNAAQSNLTDNRILGDNLVISSTNSTFADKNAADGKLVTVSGINVTGVDAANYEWNTVASTTADIGKATLVIGAAAQNKTYDGSTSASVTLSDNRVGADDLVISSSGSTFADKNAGVGKNVSVSGLNVTGADAQNYTWNTTASSTATIAKANLVVSATASDKVYNGSSAADTTLSDNRIGSDDLILSSGSSTFSDKNAGSNKTVTVSGITVTGADAQNYNLNTIATTTADIAKAQLDVTAGAASKDYDSTRNANVVLSDNRISGDNLILSSGQALFDTKDAGLGKNVAIDGINVTGADAANYTWNVTTSATADIGKAILSITAAGVNKTYDGTVNGNVVLSDNRLGSDSLIIGASDVQFIDKNAATGKQMSVSGITVTGADAGNYIWDGSVVATADINKAVLNVSASAQGKTYDGTTSVTSSLSDNRFGSDDLNITGNAAFADKNAGNNKLVTVDGISVTGADANNYTWNVDTTTTANIAKAVLNITTGAVSRDYDSTTNATAVLSDDRIAGDSLVLSHGQAKFDDKNAGMGKTVTVNDITVTGADAGNYVWNTTGTTTADIGRAVLTINTTGVNKTYDGTTDASTTFTDNRFAGDTLTIDAGEAKFIDKNAENGKQISISGINVSGADASNYIWDATAVATADITKAALNVSGLASNKVYDGNTSVSTSLVDNRILGDDLTVSNTTSAFADKNAGNGKAVIIGGITVSGADASNYTWNTDAATTANISKATLVIDATSGNKTYDSTTSATATLSDNRISGDDLSLSYSGAAFADKNAGVGKLVTVNGISVSGADAGNYTWNTSDTTSANIAKAALTVTATGNNKVYDGTTSGSVVLSDSRFANDDLSLTASSAFSDKNAGSGKALLVNGINVTGADASNYTWNTTAATSADIAKAVLNIGASAHNKVYDTTTGAVIDLTDNRISGDQLTIAGSGAFQDKNAGAGKNVNVSGISVTGTDAGNYTWNSTASASADISKANLVVSAIAGDKTYDGTTAASSSLSDNRLGSDNLVITSSGANFTDKNAGAGKSVTVNGITVSGSDAANYNWNTTAATTATINKAILTITGSAQDKTYDGSRNASTTLSDNRIGSDDLNISAASSLFADKNAGTGKVVSIDGIAVAGSDAGNYTWNVSTSAVADIAKANLNVVAVAQDKTYDGSNSATIGLSDNRVMGDDLVLNTSSAQFSDKNAGAGKVVTVGGLTLSGADATNYNVSSTVTTTATINKATLSVSSVASDKTYDGSTAASAVLSDNRIAGDSLSLSYGSAAFADKNAGNNKSVGVSGISVSGADAGNYVWNTTSTAVADIAKANLTITASGANKVYDGSTAANVSLNDNRVAGDQLNLSAGTSQFSDKNAGAGKAITVGGITVTGADAANYNWNISTAASADITKRALAISANASDKTYDGNNSASASLNDNRVLGDNLVITSAGSTFADKNAGANKQVTVSGISVTGTDADNYTFGNQATGTATINKAVLNIGAIANDKVYDATTGATASLTDNRILGDSLVVSASGTAFADKNVGANKAVNVSGITVSGADANNYTWNASTSSTANIAKAVLNVTADVQDKVYDGSTLAQTTFNDNRLGSDSLTIGSVSTSFSDKNAGVDKVVTINGITVSGADAANYTWNASTTGLADINKANLAITATGQNKVYDTTTAANVTLSDNRVVGDNLVIGNSSAAFTDKNAGAGKVITVGGITVSGADAGNYVWSGSTTATADIAKAQLTVTATANDKVYNGSTAAQTTLSDNRLAGDVLTANAGSSTFADKNAGSNKVVTVGGITLSGQDAANYEVNSVAVATATIDKASLTIGASASDKVYDGTTNANVSLTDNRVAGDKLTVSSGAAAFTDKNAGANKDVGVSGITVGGDDSINYTWNTSAIAKAAIEKARLTISGVIQDKVYDGTTSANLSGLTDNRIAGDDLSISATGAAFANKNAGANKVVNINGVDVQGADSGNYEWSSIATSAAEITKAFLSLAASGSNKVYDGTAAAGVSITDNRVSGDSFTVTVGSAAFDNKNAGQAKTITAKDIALTGEDAGNYTFANTLTTQADVQKADLGVSAGQQSKVHGKADPALSWKIDQGTLFAGDTLTGSLGRAAGEELGSYAIDQGTLSAGDNYNLTFKPGSLEIVDAPAIAPGEIDAIVSTVSKGVLNGALPVRGLKAGTPEYRLLNLGMKLPDEDASTGEQFAGQLSDQDEVEILN